MSLCLAKAIWDFLKEEYQGNERIRGMKVLNFVKEFEMQHMKDLKTIKEYSDILLSIVNKVRLLETYLSNERIVQKLLVILLKNFEATIASLENTKDLSSISLIELLNACKHRSKED